MRMAENGEKGRGRKVKGRMKKMKEWSGNYKKRKRERKRGEEKMAQLLSKLQSINLV